MLIMALSVCSKRVILLRVPGAEVSSVTNSEAMHITCAHCHEMFLVSSCTVFVLSHIFEFLLGSIDTNMCLF